MEIEFHEERPIGNVLGKYELGISDAWIAKRIENMIAVRRDIIMRDVEKTVGNIIDKQKTCYISSIDEDGFPNTKAMLQPRKRNGIKEIYFSTNTSSLKVQSFRKNPKACIYFCDSRFFRGLMIKGTVEVIEEQSIKDMIWQTGDTMYYKKGKTDPDYCVLKLTAVSGRYYSNFKSEDFIIG